LNVFLAICSDICTSALLHYTNIALMRGVASGTAPGGGGGVAVIKKVSDLFLYVGYSTGGIWEDPKTMSLNTYI
jgi:hypothetical protein